MLEFDLWACYLVVTQSLSMTLVTFIIFKNFLLFNHMCMSRDHVGMVPVWTKKLLG